MAIKGRGGISKDITKFDGSIPAVTVIAENHRLIHDGFFYTMDRRVATLADDAAIEILFAPPALTFPHLQALYLNADAGGFEIEFFEGTTTSAQGTVITPTNRNRNSANTLDTIITHTPTITLDGTSIDFVVIPAGVGPKPDAIAWDEINRGEYVLAPSIQYLLRIKNISGGILDTQIIISAYETNY